MHTLLCLFILYPKIQDKSKPCTCGIVIPPRKTENQSEPRSQNETDLGRNLHKATQTSEKLKQST